jgi:hypothetical protein
LLADLKHVKWENDSAYTHQAASGRLDHR